MPCEGNVRSVLLALLVTGCAAEGPQASSQVQPQVAGSNAPSDAPSPPPAEPPPPSPLVSDEEAALPPAVLNGNATLHCDISSEHNGRQILRIAGGQGLEFDVVVSPIVDGVVEAHGTDKGGAYRFTSHLAEPRGGNLSGVGPVVFDSLDTKVNVELEHYQQPQGAGTTLTFQSADMAARGIYVEFVGRATAHNGDRYAFRVTLGAPGEGSRGEVKPASDAEIAPIASKMVMIEAPLTTVVSTTTVQRLK